MMGVLFAGVELGEDYSVDIDVIDCRDRRTGRRRPIVLDDSRAAVWSGTRCRRGPAEYCSGSNSLAAIVCLMHAGGGE